MSEAVFVRMGETAENVADSCGITREEMDRYASPVRRM